jgi:hypothetical protein
MRKHSLKIASLLSALVLASAMVVVASVGSPGFILSASPRSEAINSAHLAHYRVELKSLEGFSGNVALGCQASSPFITCRILPNLVHVGGEEAGSATPEILMLASPTTGSPVGRYSIRISGTEVPITAGHSPASSATAVTLYVLPVDPPSQ